MKTKKKENLKEQGLVRLSQIAAGYVEISQEEWNRCSNRMKCNVFQKRTVLLNQDEVSDKIFFVVQGLLRIYFTDQKGEEKTFHFCLENTFAVDYESFLKNVPAGFSIQAVEDTTVIVITRDMLEHFYSVFKHAERLGRLITEEYFFILNDKIKMFYMQSPLQRYQEMNKRFPCLLQRVPQYQIASYLNITPVHLSRLKYASK